MFSTSRAFRRLLSFRGLLVLGIFLLVIIDLASTLQSAPVVEAIPVSQLNDTPLPADYATQVALVRSDDSALADPASLASAISREQILAMVDRVLTLEGGLDDILFAGANVVIKVNIVELAPLENGVNTDPRVVEGLIRWMEKNGPGNLRYTIAEAAGGWISTAMSKTKYNSGGAPGGDGFKQAGYTDAQQRLSADGIEVALLDANFGPKSDPLQGIRLAPVPEWIDFPEYTAYWIHEVFLDADVLINVPVMKIHSPQITVCLKNYIGIAAGAKYGTYKGVGGPDPDDPPGLHQDWPDRNSIEHEITDLASIAPSDYCLVDAIICKERAKTATDPAVRRNLVLAGPDMVAVDSICARIMGLNPDDVAHLCNAAREGLGTMDPDRIAFLSEHSLEDSLYYFERPKENYQGNRGHFGMSNRVWLLNQAKGTDIDASYLDVPDAEAIGKAGIGGWTEPIYFSDEYIDFEAYYEPSSGNVFYAFCWLTVPEEQDAELWISHDEDCALWIGGERVYRQEIDYQNISLPGHSTQTIHLKEGVQPLLVKLVDTARTAPFVMNLCRILPSKLPDHHATSTNLRTTTNYTKYEGTRILGLQFSTTDVETAVSRWKNY